MKKHFKEHFRIVLEIKHVLKYFIKMVFKKCFNKWFFGVAQLEGARTCRSGDQGSNPGPSKNFSLGLLN